MRMTLSLAFYIPSVIYIRLFWLDGRQEFCRIVAALFLVVVETRKVLVIDV